MASSRLREYFNVQYQPGERKLIQKIDFFILTFCCLSYLVNYVSLMPSEDVIGIVLAHNHVERFADTRSI